MAGNIAKLSLTVLAAATLATARFVNQAGNYPAAGGKAFGVTRFDAVSGDPVTVDVEGTTLVEAGAAVNADDVLMLDATGRVIPLAGSGKYPVGRAIDAAGAAGTLIEILLVPSSVPTP